MYIHLYCMYNVYYYRCEDAINIIMSEQYAYIPAAPPRLASQPTQDLHRCI